MKEKAPCKDCPNRHTACHDSCDTYKQWLSEMHKKQDYIKSLRGINSTPSSKARFELRRRYNCKTTRN